MKQSAVEWYEIEINSLIEKYESKEISKRDFITMKHNLFYDAKEMEKNLYICNKCKSQINEKEIMQQVQDSKKSD